MKEIKIKEVYVSITTLPRVDSIESGEKVFDRFKSTYSDHKEYLNDKQVIQSFQVDAGKSVAFARVYQICVGFVYEGKVRVNILEGDEVNILKEFHKQISSDFFKNAKLYGYNNKFIYDIVKWRSMRYKIGKSNWASQFKDIDLQPWKQTKSVSLIDEVVSGYGKISFLNAADSAGIDYDDIILGEDIFSHYRDGKVEDIIKSNVATIKGIVNLKNYLDCTDFIQETTFSVTNTDEIVEKESDAEVNALDHLISSGEITNNVLESIVSFTEEHKLNKENVYTLVIAALSNTKNNNKVELEDKEIVREALGLKSLADIKADEEKAKKEGEERVLREEEAATKEKYKDIECVLIKKSLGKKETVTLTDLYEKSPLKKRKQIVSLVDEYLKEINKDKQTRVVNSFKLLQDNLIK